MDLGTATTISAGLRDQGIRYKPNKNGGGTNLPGKIQEKCKLLRSGKSDVRPTYI